ERLEELALATVGLSNATKLMKKVPMNPKFKDFMFEGLFKGVDACKDAGGCNLLAALAGTKGGITAFDLIKKRLNLGESYVPRTTTMDGTPVLKVEGRIPTSN